MPILSCLSKKQQNTRLISFEPRNGPWGPVLGFKIWCSLVPQQRSVPPWEIAEVYANQGDADVFIADALAADDTDVAANQENADVFNADALAADLLDVLACLAARCHF